MAGGCGVAPTFVAVGITMSWPAMTRAWSCSRCRSRSGITGYMWEDLIREDIALLEGLQRGRAAPAYDGGVLSPYWDEAPRALARHLARTMREEAGRC